MAPAEEAAIVVADDAVLVLVAEAVLVVELFSPRAPCAGPIDEKNTDPRTCRLSKPPMQ
jgi:hypothetical protein